MSTLRQVGAAGDSEERVVLLPVDGSQHARQAFTWYRENMRRHGDKLIFVNVAEVELYHPCVGLAMGEAVPDLRTAVDDSIRRGKSTCQEYIHKANEHNMKNEALIMVDNRTGQTIVNAARENNAALIIMGNRGLGTLRRTFLGSVSDYVLQHAQRPVIIVPPAS